MDCKKVQNIIITDYIDGELLPEEARRIREHLSGCEECRLFESALIKSAVKPLRKMPHPEPCEDLWRRIHDRIRPKPQKSFNFSRILRSTFLRRVSLPKPVFAACAVTVIVLTVAIISTIRSNNRESLRLYLEDQMQFMQNGGVSELAPNESNTVNLGTAIEEYFIRGNFS